MNVKIRKNDQFRQGHQCPPPDPRDTQLHVVKQLLAFMRAVGSGPRPGRSFDLSRLPTAAMAVWFLGHVGYKAAALLSGISAERGDPSTAIELGDPEPILWMQRGHAQNASVSHVGGIRALALL